MLKKYEIDINQYQVMSKIKSGSFGSVFLVQDIQTHEKYAAKIIDSCDIQRKKLINREINIMARLKHPTIIKFYGYSLQDFSGNQNVTLLMQLATKGSLAELLSKVQHGIAEHGYDNTARDISCKFLICQNCAMRNHQDHKLICAGIVEKKVCQNSEINA